MYMYYQLLSYSDRDMLIWQINVNCYIHFSPVRWTMMMDLPASVKNIQTLHSSYDKLHTTVNTQIQDIQLLMMIIHVIDSSGGSMIKTITTRIE